MIEGPYLVLAVLGVLATGLMAGVFCAFSVLVMRGLAALPPAQGVAAMNAINRTAMRPAFMVVFGGAALACVVIAVVTFVMWPDEGTVELLVGSGLYLAGAFGVTVVANVPRNDALLRLEAGSPEAVRSWPLYLREWTRWNHVRALASAAAALAYLLALV
ncbi:anthrone oxygenase family protein [Streptomyces griseosporeus]|uniref:anthrone oxygenase family protein n=1 Tax=Streptomyces griseosporeus TaxID=1910 RepID=UPI00167D1DEF|nr:anthrone oxygenase family protein [Streptomyces griseosporeus]GHF89205.1 membrane protein [Streptomyces griseosporeus]